MALSCLLLGCFLRGSLAPGGSNLPGLFSLTEWLLF
jgi:hypothetical protein